MPSYRASDGAALAYYDQGPSGEIPLLLVHGWQADHRVWTPLGALLARERRVVSVDLRGAGASSEAPGPYRIERFADDLAELIEAIDLDPVVAVGHSMGGKIAVRFALEHPEALEGLVLIAPVALGPARLPPKLEAVLRSTIGDPVATARWLARLTLGERSEASTQLLRGAAASVPPEVARESLESWTTLDLAADAATSDTPALVLAPEGDAPQIARATVADVLGGSRFAVVAQAGHYAMLDRPERLADAIEDFIENF